MGWTVGLLLGGICLSGALQVSRAWEQARGFLANPFATTARVTPSGPVLLEQVQRLQRLETCRYQGQVVVRGDRKGLLPQWLSGDQLLFVGRGEVVAGVDLSRLRAEDVRVERGAVSLRLPPVEILHSRLDNRSSEVFERRSGFFSGPDPQLETQVRVEAEERIRQAALDGGVLSTAETNAREALRKQLQPLGFSEVRFL